MLLTRPPLSRRIVRLACVKPAASVRSEPGSNSQVELTANLSCPVPRAGAGLALVMRSILTSSQSLRAEANPGSDFHGVFKRPHLSAYRRWSVRPSPERRRLRFSFQINDVKDLTGLPAPPGIARRLRRRRLSSRLEFPCQAVPFTQEPLGFVHPEMGEVASLLIRNLGVNRPFRASLRPVEPVSEIKNHPRAAEASLISPA